MERLHTLLKRLLHWSQKHTKTDMRYMVGGALWLTGEQGVVALVALGLAVAFAHLIPPDDYGHYRFILSIFWALTAVSLTGLSTALSRAVAKGAEGSYRLAVRLSLLGGIPVAVAGLLISGYYALQGNALLSSGVLVIALLGPFFQAAVLFGPLIVGKQDFKRAALSGICLSVFPALLMLAAMFLTDNPVIFIGLYLAGTIITGIVLSIRTYRAYQLNRTVDPEMRKHSIHFSIMNVLSVLSQQADKITVFHYVGALELALYAFAVALPDQIKGFSSNIATLAFPKFAERASSALRDNLWGRVWLLTGALALIAFAYILVAPFVFDILFAPYRDAVIYSQVLALVIVFGANEVLLTVLQAKAATRELYIFNIVSPLFAMGTLVVLTIFFGLWGAVIARLLSRAGNALLLTILVSIVLRRPEPSVS